MSKLTLEEAISHCLEVAEKNESKAQKIGCQFLGTTKDREATECRECAADYRQLAEWLKELKNLREENKVLISGCDRLINAKEKKPNTYEDVLVLFEYENYGRDFATSLKVGVAHYVMGKWYGDDLYKYPKSKVIYWQSKED